MKLNELKELSKEFLAKLQNFNGAENLLDDGADSGDEKQNKQFVQSSESLRDIHTAIARMDCNEINLDALWNASWEKGASPDLPECIYNHDISYLLGILSAER